MKKLFFMLLMVLCATSASARDMSLKTKSFQTKVKNFLTTEGYKPTIDDDGDIKFKKEGEEFWVILEDDDDGYYMIFMTSSLDCESANKQATRKAINRVTHEYKVGKCYLDENRSSVEIHVETFLTSLDAFSKYFERYCDILTGMKDDLKEYYSEYAE